MVWLFHNHLCFGWNKSSIPRVRCENIPDLHSVLIAKHVRLSCCFVSSRTPLLSLPDTSCRRHSSSRCIAAVLWLLTPNWARSLWEAVFCPVFTLRSYRQIQSSWAPSYVWFRHSRATRVTANWAIKLANGSKLQPKDSELQLSVILEIRSLSVLEVLLEFWSYSTDCTFVSSSSSFLYCSVMCFCSDGGAA